MIDNYIEITSNGYEFEEGWQRKMFSGLSYNDLISEKKRIGDVNRVSWTKNGLKIFLSFDVAILSRSISDDRKYFSLSTDGGVFLYSDDGFLIDKIEFPICFNGIKVLSGKIISQDVRCHKLRFKVLAEDQDFYFVYSICDRRIEVAEWCR